LAEKCPDTPFLMVMNPADPAVVAEVRRRRPPNVRVVEQVPYARMPEYLQRAFIFVSTGLYEGLPNVFLQAAACGVPIASWEVDPGFIAEHQCGFVAGGDADALANYIRQIQADPELGRDIGRRGREYVRRHHDLPLIGAQIVQVVCDALAGRLEPRETVSPPQEPPQ
jgi:glycosyltransferase involved in cell wall biosynthesis